LRFENKIKNIQSTKQTRVLGVGFALELQQSQKNPITEPCIIITFFIENGIILRPVGNIVYILPPYTRLATQKVTNNEKL
jgi:adenosylmethionine-8-amino-7-oxononanoate aminotransferase